MHQRVVTLLAAGAMLVSSGCTTLRQSSSSAGAPTPGQQTAQQFRDKLTRPVALNYLLFLPKDYSTDTGKKWPLMLFLHGAGERGTNVNLVTVHGPPKLVKTNADFPFVLVSPQCPSDQIWHDDELLALLDSIIAKYRVDPSRVYLTGLSMGGYGSWSLGTRYPERFAAIAPICGGGDLLPILLVPPAKKAALQSLGVWAFHGGKDPVVPLAESQKMTNAMTRAGDKDVKLTVFPEAGHDAWTQAYQEPGLWNWFLAHQRSPVR